MRNRWGAGFLVTVGVITALALGQLSISSKHAVSVRSSLAEEWARSRPTIEGVLSKPDVMGSDLRPVVTALNRINGLLPAYVQVNPQELWILTKFNAEVLPVFESLQEMEQPLTLDQRRQMEDAFRTLVYLGELWQRE